uniref:Ras domain containing protein n=1 Tax=Haemonchus contortus TaxID=6289 RepID=A0A7I4Y7K9_HAECO
VMDDNNYDRHFRLLICGGKGTGKSTLLSCFSFESDRSEGTTMLRLDDLNIRIDVRKRDKWQREHVSEFDAVVVIFAADDFKSFDYALEVLRSVQNCDFLPVVVIENKIDLIDEYNFLNKDIIENSIRQARTRLYRVSAKQDFNVMHPFAYVLEKLLRYSDENANVKEKDSLQNGRLSCRQGWIERSTSTSSRKRNANCSIM